MARRSGLGKRLDQILRDSQEGRYPAYERLFEKTTPGEPTSAYQEYFDELEEKEARRLADERRREEDRRYSESERASRLSATEILYELGISIRDFDVFEVEDSKVPDRGPTASTRISRYYFSKPGGSSDTAREIERVYYDFYDNTYGKVKASDFKDELMCNLYVEWRRGNTRGGPTYVSSFSPVSFGEFERFKRQPSLGKKIATYADLLDYERYSADEASSMYHVEAYFG